MIRKAEISLATSKGRLIYRIRWQVRLWAAVVFALVWNCAWAFGANWFGWEAWNFGAIALWTIGTAVYCLWPNDPFAVGDLTVNGLQLGEKFMPTAELGALQYREGKDQSLYAGEICIGPGLGPAEAGRLQTEIEKVMGVRHED